MERAQAMIGDTIPDPFPGDAWAFLATVYKDKTNPIGVRVDAAKAAINYEKPRLNAIDMRLWASMNGGAGPQQVIEARLLPGPSRAALREALEAMGETAVTDAAFTVVEDE